MTTDTGVEVTVKTTITCTHPDAVTLHVDFQSGDIGHTQGTTLRFAGGQVLLAQYRPGTSHWSRALEAARELVQAVYEWCVTDKLAIRTIGDMQLIASELIRDSAYNRPWDGYILAPLEGEEDRLAPWAVDLRERDARK